MDGPDGPKGIVTWQPGSVRQYPPQEEIEFSRLQDQFRDAAGEEVVGGRLVGGGRVDASEKVEVVEGLPGIRGLELAGVEHHQPGDVQPLHSGSRLNLAGFFFN